MSQDNEVEHIYIVETQYLCGASLGFATKHVDVAAKRAAEVMSDICPECKLKAGIELTDEEKQIISLAPEDIDWHKVAKTN